ncbi:MAG: helix-turn-helix transcriptional regulator [Planctomycetes bacterium]|nr:helix-turn-helix transcriptional regulator [Planctomycetota bacterium]
MAPKPRLQRSVCPVACTLDLIGDRWTLLVIRDLWAGKTTWSELADSPEGIATNILADRLQKLVEQGLVAREPATGRARSYGLTRLGLSLEPVLAAMRDWGLANVAGTEARVGSVAEERNGASRKPRPTP